MSDTLEKRVERVEKKLGLKKRKRSKQTTRILVIQDRSGSMFDRISETISGYNEYIDDLARDDSDKAYLTLVQFDDEYLVIEEDVPVEEAEPLDEETYVPRGMTALLDAVGKGVTDLKRRMKTGDRALVVIMTDGGENHSTQYNKQKVQKLIRDCEKTDRWSFVFLGAGQDSWSGGSMLGLGRKQAVWYGTDSFSHKVSYAGLAGTTSALRRSASPSMSNTGQVASNVMKEKGAEVQIEEKDNDSKEK